MEIIRKFGVVIGIVAVVLILVVLRSSGDNFKPDAVKWAQPSYSQGNIITSEKLPEGKMLIIQLDENLHRFQNEEAENLTVPPAAILEKQNVRKIKKHNGPVLLASADPAISAGIWMILSQMGMKNIYILSETGDNEALKHEFRPDTLILPEL